MPSPPQASTSATTTTPPPSLSSLLTSLHTHLQSQTALLPTLHTQLGLPPSALSDELTTLQHQLLQCVEAQVDVRKREVDVWITRCEQVERECARYAIALGSVHGKTVKDTAKESVLPRRYELGTEVQERLRQLYHSKLEQLSALAHRLGTISRTLGSDFFVEDFSQLVPAPGESELDPDAFRDVTPDRFSKLEKELVRGKGEVSKRLNHLSSTFVQIDWLYTELGMAAPTLSDLPVITTSTSSRHLTTSQLRPDFSTSTSADPFMATSTPTPISRSASSFSLSLPTAPSPQATEQTFHKILATFVARMEEADAESLPRRERDSATHPPIGLENVEPTPALLGWAASLLATLEETKRRREAHIQTMYDQLEGLWKRLGVAEEDMEAFVEANRGSTEESVKGYEDELERMIELKRERMGVFVGSAREEIWKLWDDMLIGDEERADFAPFVDEEHTEELLTIHEDEIRRLKEERRMKAPLLSSIKKYFEICDEEKELAAAATDQTRLLGRGSRDPGRLLREEKMRKRVTKEKPRLEQDLLTAIPAWEQEMRKPFLVHGESILQLLMETVSAADQENKRKPPRAGSVPPRATTPVNMTNGHSAGFVPGGKTGVVTPAIRSGGVLANSAPNKRQKLDSGGSGGKGQQGQKGAVFGTYRAGNVSATGRAVSPSKIPGRSGSGNGNSGVTTSSLPRPTGIAMPVPKVGSVHHGLGHGRVPSAMAFAGTGGSGRAVSASSMGSGGASRYAAMKKAERARRESFKPRPSVDGIYGDLGRSGGRWGGFEAGLKEEDEE